MSTNILNRYSTIRAKTLWLALKSRINQDIKEVWWREIKMLLRSLKVMASSVAHKGNLCIVVERGVSNCMEQAQQGLRWMLSSEWPTQVADRFTKWDWTRKVDLDPCFKTNKQMATQIRTLQLVAGCIPLQLIDKTLRLSWNFQTQMGPIDSVARSCRNKKTQFTISKFKMSVPSNRCSKEIKGRGASVRTLPLFVAPSKLRIKMFCCSDILTRPVYKSCKKVATVVPTRQASTIHKLYINWRLKIRIKGWKKACIINKMQFTKRKQTMLIRSSCKTNLLSRRWWVRIMQLAATLSQSTPWPSTRREII